MNHRTHRTTKSPTGIPAGRAVTSVPLRLLAACCAVGAFALDTNLVDSDLFDSRTNMEGFILGANYALGPATQLSLTYANGERKNNTVIAPGSGDIGANNALADYWLLQVDLNVKF